MRLSVVICLMLKFIVRQISLNFLRFLLQFVKMPYRTCGPNEAMVVSGPNISIFVQDLLRVDFILLRSFVHDSFCFGAL